VRSGGEAPVRAGAILAAAGRGERLGLGDDGPKAMVELCGRPLAAHSLAVLEAAPFLEAVVLVVPAGMRDRFTEDLVRRFGFRKVTAIVEGGPTRQESVGLGLEALEGGLDPIVVHDAARPLVTSGLLSACVFKAVSFGACVPGVRPSGTVKRVTAGGVVDATLDRESLREIQTPQAFRASLIREAHRLARESGFQATDDAALVERMGEAVAVVEGDPDNLKITRPIDLDIAAAVLGRGAAGGVA
jgi:2-C-methyl-D-erythritol 4-phosphate cytidylyltransferase